MSRAKNNKQKNGKKGRKLRLLGGIRLRLALGLAALALLSAAALYVLCVNQVGRNMESRITRDLLTLQTNTQVYVRQYLLLSERDADEESFRQCAQEIADELYSTGGTNLSLYSLSGEKLLGRGGEHSNVIVTGGSAAASEQKLLRPEEENAFEQAKNGAAAYGLHYGEGRSCSVLFAMPVAVSGENIGLITYALDYSEQYRQYVEMARMLLFAAMGLFAVTCVAVLMYLNHILAPVRRLSRRSSYAADQIRNGRIPTLPQSRRKKRRRRDEISELDENYDLMLRTVGQQFSRIQEDRARILQLLDSRQAFYNNVTHELKTPLTTIKGYAQLMEENGAQDEELFRSGLEHIQHESTRLHRMVTQLLEMSNIDRDDVFEPVNLGSITEQVADAMALKARRYDDTIRMWCSGRPVIQGKEERIRQLCINLIDNAIKYGAAEQPITVECTQQGKQAVLRVSNFGPGMTAEEIEHIFEPFYRTDKERSREMGSAGLGLSICMKIVREHGGTLSAQSVPGGETTFTAIFPLLRKEGADDEAEA